MSDDKQNAYFAAGVQDEILTDLAKVADLKVTSRTSARSYEAGKARNSREIGEQLGVAHLLEGSVQRSNNRLRINAQLIDARSDSHLWAQTYDRDVADLFAVQSEIAQTIAEQLQAKMSASEKAAIAQPATTDLLANDLYLQAVALELQPPEGQNLPKAVSLLEQAVGRDPHFLRAYCALSRMHLDLYYNGYDRTAARLATACAVIEKAALLQPDSGEVHLARANYYFGFGVRDYDRAREELELARRTLPNDPAVYRQTARVDGRQGRWTEAVRNLKRALELDPRNADLLADFAATYDYMHRHTEAGQFARRVLVLLPHDYWARLGVAAQAFNERADTGPLRAELNAILKEEPGAASKIAGDLWHCALFERDGAAAESALAAFPAEGIPGRPELIAPREWYAGYLARTFNRPEAARVSFNAARTILEKLVREQPDNASAWSLLGRVDAALGQKEQAIKAGRRACELLPLSKEPTSGLRTLIDLAKIYAWVGEKDMALQLLAAHAADVGGPSYGELKLDPNWEPLRGDPRFEKIVASLAPKNR